jgi:hypothetical protein
MEKKRLTTKVVSFLFALICLFQTSALAFEITWDTLPDAVSYEVAYNLNGDHGDPLNWSGTGLTIGNSPANIGNTTTAELKEFPLGTKMCTAIRAVYADSTKSLYSPVVCGTSSASSTNYELWADYQFTAGAKAIDGYCIPIVEVNGEAWEGSLSHTLTEFSGTGQNTIVFEYAPGDVVLYTQQAEGGTIYPEDFVIGYYYQPFSVTITPDTGKCLQDLYDNGSSVFYSVVDNYYEIINPLENHSLLPVFGSCFTATASAGAGGSITPSSVQLDFGESATFSITENAGFYLASLTDNGASVINQVYNGQYTVEYVNEDHEIQAIFEMIVPSDIFVPQFGFNTDIVLKGDWNGDGKDEIGVARKGTTYYSFYLDKNGDGIWNGSPVDIYIQQFGFITDIPLSGDWNGDGIDSIGVARKGTTYYSFYLDKNGDGIWNGSPVDIYIQQFGLIEDIPLSGDWNGDGIDSIGVARKGTTYCSFYLDKNGNGTWEP